MELAIGLLVAGWLEFNLFVFFYEVARTSLEEVAGIAKDKTRDEYNVVANAIIVLAFLPSIAVAKLLLAVVYALKLLARIKLGG